VTPPVEPTDIELIRKIATAGGASAGVEVGNAVDAEDHRLTVNDELAMPVLQRGLDDPRMTTGPVVTAAAEQAHAASLALNDQAITVVLDFMEPDRSRRDDLAAGRKAWLKCASHRRGDMRPAAKLRIRPFTQTAVRRSRLNFMACKRSQKTLCNWCGFCSPF
jgi:hypothetical protein